jgi:DNA polymerase-4
MHRVIGHIDMDAFYASVEQRDHPAWRGKPVIVGAPPTQRGVVATCSYEARRFGVHSAMPSVTAGRLCPTGIFVPPRMDVYRAVSRQIMTIIASTGAPIEQVSVDEAYFDLSEHCHGHDADAALRAAVPIATALKSRIRSELQLTATVGIGSNKLLAKIASDMKKPDGLTVILESDKVAALRDLPVRKLYGVGEVTERQLANLGIHTIGDLQGNPVGLREAVGSFEQRLKLFAVGIDDRPLVLEWEQKSHSGEETFLQDTSDPQLIMTALWQQSTDLEMQLTEAKKEALTVTVKVRYSDFTTLSRQVTLDDPVREAKEIYITAHQLLQRHGLLARPLRLIGLEVSNLQEPGARQLRLF